MQTAFLVLQHFKHLIQGRNVFLQSAALLRLGVDTFNPAPWLGKLLYEFPRLRLIPLLLEKETRAVVGYSGGSNRPWASWLAKVTRMMADQP